MWAGPIANWIAGDLILDMDVDVVVPGHGPITDNSGVRGGDYLALVDGEARRRHDRGMTAAEAARDPGCRAGDVAAAWGEEAASPSTSRPPSATSTPITSRRASSSCSSEWPRSRAGNHPPELGAGA